MKKRASKWSTVSLSIMLFSFLIICICIPTQPVPAHAEKVIKLKYSNPYLEMEPPNQYGYHFCDYIEKKTGGRVQIKRFPGGVLGKPLEHLELVRSGSVDIAAFIIPLFPKELPLNGYNYNHLGSREAPVRDFYKITMEIPETSAILQKEQERQNIKILNWHAIGVSGIICRDVARSLKDLKGKKVGVILEDKALEAMGLNTVGVQVPEMYEALSRGVVDALSMSLGPMVMLKWHEVSKSYMSKNSFAVGQPIVVNLQMWNALPADIQQVFKEAALSSMEFSIGLDEKITNGNLQAFKEAGLIIEGLPPREQEQLFELWYKINSKDWMDTCEKAGVGDEARVVLKYIDKMTWGK